MLDVNQIHVRLNGYQSSCRDAHSEEILHAIAQQAFSNSIDQLSSGLGAREDRWRGLVDAAKVLQS
jgi:hypothetical protein